MLLKSRGNLERISESDMSKVEEKTKAPSECSANLVGESKKIDNLAGVEKLKVKTMNGVVNGVSEIKGKGQAKNSKRTVKGKQVNGTEPLVTTKKHHKDHDESHNNHVTNHNVTNDLVDGVTKEESGGLLNKPDLNKDNAAVGTGSESKKEVNGLSENATKNEQELSPKNSKNIDAKTCLNEETLSSKCDVVAAVENLQIDGPTQILQTSIADCKTAGRDDILYVQYESELQMTMIMKIIQKDLSEPYSIYTYRYFIHNWPNLCFLVSALFNSSLFNSHQKLVLIKLVISPIFNV